MNGYILYNFSESNLVILKALNNIQVGLVSKITTWGLGLVFNTTNIQLRYKQLSEMVPGVKLNSIENNYRIKKKEEKGGSRHQMKAYFSSKATKANVV